MEYVFEDVNEAFPVMWHRMWSNDGVTVQESRNGPVRVSDTPVTIIYRQPRRRVLFHPVRDANPFFHLFEAIWMLAGRDDVAWLAKFNAKMADYSDDGVSLTSAYGKRWNAVMPEIISKLLDRNTRRAYIPIFWPEDAKLNGADLPCNVGVSFQPRGDYLHMSVFNRSNDMIFGSLGANVVQFSMLQEFVAAITGYNVGTYAQISANFHIYTEFEITKRLMGHVQPTSERHYDVLGPSPHKVMNTHFNAWQEDAAQFIDVFTSTTESRHLNTWGFKWNDPFFEHVAVPMYCSWSHWKYARKGAGRYAHAIDALGKVQAPDWQTAGYGWLERRAKKAIRAMIDAQ